MNIKANKLIQLLLITLTITGIVGFYLYIDSTASTKINSSQDMKLTDGLVGYWSFDGNHMDWSATGAEALDQAGSNDGDASTSGMSSSNATSGKVGQALDFNGSSDYVSAGDIDITDAITASAWINLESFDGGTIFPGIISKNYSTAWYFGMSSNTRNLTIWINNVARATTVGEPINFNEWAHVAFTYDKDAGGTDEVKIYVNGSQVVTGDYSTAIGTNNDSIDIGKNFGQKFDGKIDEVRLYDRSLSSNEITELYNQGQSKINASQDSKLTDGLTGYWSFDGNHIDWNDPADEILDQSVNSYHGNATNNPTATIGKVGQALNFNSSSSQYINETVNIRTLFGSRIGTLSLWMRPTGAPVSASTWEENLPGAVTEINNAGFGIFRGNFEGSGDKIWAANSWEQRATLSFNFNLGEWVHVVWRLDDTNACLYKNGVQESCTSHSSRYSSGDMNIGRGYLNYFDGDIDEVRTYNRVLTDNEITELYNQGQVKINASQDSKLTDGLVGNWTFDGNHTDWSAAPEVKDQAGSNDGTVTSMDNSNAVIGKVGQALDFDGANEYVVTGGDLGADGDWTIQLWSKIDSLTGLQGSIGLNSQSRGMFFVNNGGFKWGMTDSTTWTYSSIITAGVWDHFAVTYNGTSVSLYRNGVFETSGSFTDTNLNTIAIGINAGSGWYFDGSIDEVRVYNRALSSDEITQLYNLGK